MKKLFTLFTVKGGDCQKPKVKLASRCETSIRLAEDLVVIDERTMAQMNGEYVLPPNAGPAWRAAHEAGLDMSLIEGALRLTPEQRLAEHQQVIDFLLEVEAAGVSHATR